MADKEKDASLGKVKSSIKKNTVNTQFIMHNIKDVVSYYINNAYTIPKDKKIAFVDYYIDTKKDKVIIQFAVSKDD